MTKRPDKNLDPTKLVLNKSISNDTYSLIQVGNIGGGMDMFITNNLIEFIQLKDYVQPFQLDMMII